MSIEDQEICCHVSPLDKIEAEDDSLSCQMFSIDVFATFMHNQEDHQPMEEDESELYDQDCDMIQNKFLVERQMLLQDQETSKSTINQILLDMDIPIQPFMVDRILAFARQMASNKRYKGRKVLHMRVDIDVPPMNNGDDNSDSDSPTKNSTVALDIIKIEKESMKQCCVICLEEISIGLEATRMPCSHFYHRGCIINWLEKSRACPLCRFEICW